jgi:tRNA(fMet)-specific endonuclease VapC
MRTSRGVSVICLETSFLVRYLRGDAWTEAYLESVGPDVPVLVSSVSLYELFAGAIRSRNESIEWTRQRLPGVEIIGFDEAIAAETAEIRAALLDRGEPIPGIDTLIAGTARNADATLIAVDEHFDRVPDLDVYDPRDA